MDQFNLSVRAVAILSLLSLVSCAKPEAPVQQAPITLYRNSPLDASMRIHFASFDAPDGINFNLSNCQMTARLLNANVSALMAESGSDAPQEAGFWCEVGEMTEEGVTPDRFDREFPTEIK